MMTSSQGFALIEVLVALALLATVLTASYTLEAQSITQIKRIKQHIVTNWVGENLIAEIKLGIFPVKIPSTLEGKTQLLEQTIPWRIKSQLSSNKKQLIYTLELDTKKNHPPLQTIKLYVPAN